MKQNQHRTGRNQEPERKNPEGWRVTFEVKDKAGKVVATGSNKSDGSISFNNKLNYKLSDLEKWNGSYESEKT